MAEDARTSEPEHVLNESPTGKLLCIAHVPHPIEGLEPVVRTHTKIRYDVAGRTGFNPIWVRVQHPFDHASFFPCATRTYSCNYLVNRKI